MLVCQLTIQKNKTNHFELFLTRMLMQFLSFCYHPLINCLIVNNSEYSIVTWNFLKTCSNLKLSLLLHYNSNVTNELLIEKN